MIAIKAKNKGKLHRTLGVAQGKAIPPKMLGKAAKSSNPTLKKEAVFAENAKGWDHSGSSKPKKQAATPINTDRGAFKLK